MSRDVNQDATRAEPLNLLNLAKTEPGIAKSALERDLSVQALTEPLTLSPAKLWLVVLEGSLIVDLPHGDFYTLKVGDSVRLGAEQATLTPLQDAVFLFAELADKPLGADGVTQPPQPPLGKGGFR